MKKILAMCILLSVSISAIGQNISLQESIKDISTELASINQQLVEENQVVQTETPNLNGGVQVQKTDEGTILIKVPIAFQGSVMSQYKVVSSHHQGHTDKRTAQKPSQDVYESIISRMRALERRYENNPYIRVAGFSINIGVPPSVTISIEFKK